MSAFDSINEPGSRLPRTPVSINEPPPQIGGPGNSDPDLPRTTGIDPLSCTIGDPPLRMQVFGTGFTAATLIVFDGVPSVTTFVSATEVDLDLSPAALTEARDHPVTVAQGATVMEPAMMFTVKAATPS